MRRTASTGTSASWTPQCGHYLVLRLYENHLRPEVAPACRWCGEGSETISHIFQECLQLAVEGADAGASNQETYGIRPQWPWDSPGNWAHSVVSIRGRKGKPTPRYTRGRLRAGCGSLWQSGRVARGYPTTTAGCTRDTSTQHLHEEISILPIKQHLALHASQLKQKAQHPGHTYITITTTKKHYNQAYITTTTTKKHETNHVPQYKLHNRQILPSDTTTLQTVENNIKLVHTAIVQRHKQQSNKWHPTENSCTRTDTT